MPYFFILQRLQLLKELRDLLDIGDKRKETKRLEMEDSEYFDVIPQKRFRPFRTQTRAGMINGTKCKPSHKFR